MSFLAVPKRYVDRAVQTDFALMSSSMPGFTIDISDTSTCFLPPLDAILHQETDSSEETPAKPSAYMHSDRSTFDDTARILPARGDRKALSLASGLGYPSAFVTTAKQRITSLPEQLSSGVARLAVVEKRTRVVSMPECGKLNNLVSASENTGANVDLPAGSTARSYPSDVPQTPSPPSSPDSVMIIGNEEQVSGSFLQSRRRSFIDEDGWVSWASSPPRPIPALHGPLSLPYARCPSGAEGTVVEGDDLTHKIWGLGADDGPAHTRYHRMLSHTAPQAAQTTRSPEIKAHTFGDQYQASSHQRRRDTVIDLSQPSTFDHIQDATQQRPRNSVNTAARGSTVKDSNNLPDLTASALAKLAALPHVHQQDHRDAPKKTYGVDATTKDQLGLALQWESLFNSDAQAKLWMNGPKSSSTGQGSSNRLNTSAPPFVPQSYVSQSLLDRAILQEKLRYSQIEQTQRPAYHTSGGLSAMHSAQDNNAQSPPSTASPLWTPIFAQAGDPMHHAHGKSFQSRAGQYMPGVYSPELELGGLYQSDQLSTHMVSQLQNYDLQGLGHGSLGRDKYSSQASLGDGYAKQELNQPRGRSPVIDIHQQQPPVLLDTSNHPHGGSGNTTTTMDRRRSLTQQHPRSIPLARLIQRRLSSVVEEEVLPSNYGDNALSPSSFQCPLPSGAPVRRLPVSPEALRAAHSSTIFGQRSRGKITGAYAEELERQSVFRGGVPDDLATGGRLQQLDVKDDKKAVVKLPVARVDASRSAPNRSGGGRAAAATKEYTHMNNSQEGASSREEKENANSNTQSVTGNTTAGRTPKKNHYIKYKKRAERVSAVSAKAERSS